MLDVGCAGMFGTMPHDRHDSFLHLKVRQAARELVGLDVNREQVEKLQEQGFDIILGDAESANLGRTFEVILAGELLEHLSNPGLFLENMHRHLERDGALIITTPNRTSLFSLLYVLLHSEAQAYTKPMPGHVLCMDMESLKTLAGRHGFTVKDYCYYTPRPEKITGRLIWGPMIKWRPALAVGLIAILVKDHGQRLV